MALAETTIGGRKYFAGQLLPIQQFHIARKLAPVLGGLTKVLPGLQSLDGEDTLAALAKLDLDCLAAPLAQMSEADAEFVLFGLLACVTRDQGAGMGSAPVVRQGSLMFDDIHLLALMQLAGLAFKANLAPFLRAAN